MIVSEEYVVDAIGQIVEGQPAFAVMAIPGQERIDEDRYLRALHQHASVAEIAHAHSVASVFDGMARRWPLAEICPQVRTLSLVVAAKRVGKLAKRHRWRATRGKQVVVGAIERQRQHQALGI